VKTYDEARTGATLRARELRRNSTPPEQLLWSALREKLPGYKWRRQMPVGPFFADFACFAEKLIVELDGGQHSKTAEYDARRAAYLESQRYRVLRFWNDDVLSNTDGVLETIAQALSTSPSRGVAAHPSPSGRGKEAGGVPTKVVLSRGPRSAGRVRP
jgi:very-short-patch-repair endonuclease